MFKGKRPTTSTAIITVIAVLVVIVAVFYVLQRTGHDSSSNTIVATSTAKKITSITDHLPTGQLPVPGTFNYTGSVQKYIVPAGATSIYIQAFGAQGGGNVGGFGGFAKGTLAVTPGQVLNVYVGGRRGYNGGGTGAGIPGGGASDVRTGTSLSSRVIVAAGGGGSGLNLFDPGGVGGGYVGGNAPGIGGGGATATNGGHSGNGSQGYVGNSGSYGHGGSGSNGTGSGVSSGGGGYYGGGGGGSVRLIPGGGGGGSSYTGSMTNAITTPGIRTGNGEIIITLLPQPSFKPTCTLSTSPTIVSKNGGNTSTLTYTTSNATSFSINNSVGTLTPVVGGSKLVNLPELISIDVGSTGPSTFPQTTTYTGTAKGPGGTVTCDVTVVATSK